MFSISAIRWLDTSTVRPSAASDFIRVRIHLMPSGSSPPRDRFRLTSARPARPRTSSTRVAGIRLVWARQRRWLRALRPPCTARASSSAPISRIGAGDRWCGWPLMVTIPALGRSRPRISRMVVVFPAPFRPRNPVTAPRRIRKLRSVTAGVDPYRLVSPRATIITHPLLAGLGSSAATLRTRRSPRQQASTQLGVGAYTQRGRPARRRAAASPRSGGSLRRTVSTVPVTKRFSIR